MSRNRREKGAGIEGDGGHRHVRLQQIVGEEIAALLRDECSDPRLDDVVLLGVELSVDYKNAKVRYVLPKRGSEDDRRRAQVALDRAAAFIRGRLAESIDVKIIPSIRFVWDRDAADAPSFD